MFVGHYGPAFALKRFVPESSLFALCIGVQLVDIAWGVFVLAGIEHVRIVPGFTECNSLDLHHIPYTHSLIAAVVWSVIGGIAAWLYAGRKSPRIGVAAALAVASHWILDLLMHRPDLPLYGDSKVGLGLWNYRWPALFAELISLGIGLALYATSTRPRDAIGRAGPLVLFVALTGAQLVNLLLDPATTPQATAISGLLSFVSIPLAVAWLDKHRSLSKSLG
ncbi:MAG: hypothetical protein H0V17_27895 [Deltaproteobacteria bacterium]|nr:hypothetical protein [Deltaproteobacteria bacterium]